MSKELTFREHQIVDLVAQGKTNKEVAFHLLLTEGTIKEYLNRIFKKAGVSNRTELAIWSLAQRPPVRDGQSDDNRFESRPAFEKSSMII
jgi:DNA-binding NarL/FixJ family response regulator